MRFSIQLPTDRVDAPDEFLRAPALAELGRAAEDAGFDACFVTDHPAPPQRFLDTGGHSALDPFVALSFVAAATQRLRLQLHVLIAPYRNPFLAAKSIATLDRLSGGRTIVGMAAGYLEPEFEALGADFAHRNEVTDDAIRTMKRIFRETAIDHDGPGYRARGITALPRPLQQPHPPIWIGGNSRRAMRRAAALGDGWLPFPNPGFAKRVRTASIADLDELRERLTLLRRYEREAGRTRPLDVAFVPFGVAMHDRGAFDPGAFRARVAELEALGIGWLTLGAPSESRAAFCRFAARFGDEVIAALPCEAAAPAGDRRARPEPQRRG